MHDLKQVQSAFLRNWPISAWPFLMLCCSGGLIKVIYAFGYGYGISMFVQGCLAYFVHKARPGSSLLAASLYACYGLRLTWYLYRRQHDDSFISSTHGQNLEERMSSTPLMVKLNIVFFVSAVQQATLYVLDMICASRSRRTIRVALSVAFCGLLLEALSDEQKLAAKAENPEMPVTAGLFSIIRHPNYLGEILFWLGVSGRSRRGLEFGFVLELTQLELTAGTVLRGLIDGFNAM